MQKAVIIDDEPDARITLSNFIQKYCPGIEISGEACSVEDGLKLLSTSTPDFVFLDIQMSDGSGFDLLDKIREKDFHVIFTTAHEEYAVKAFRYSAVDYLLKPIDPDELTAAVQRAGGDTGVSTNGEKLSALSYNIHNKANPRLAIPDLKGITFVTVKDIIYCRSNNNYTIFTTKNGEEIVAAKTLKDFEDLLAPFNFCRIHQTHMINVNYIKRYVRGEGGAVVMTDDTELEVSRRKKAELMEKLGK